MMQGLCSRGMISSLAKIPLKLGIFRKSTHWRRSKLLRGLFTNFGLGFAWTLRDLAQLRTHKIAPRIGMLLNGLFDPSRSPSPFDFFFPSLVPKDLRSQGAFGPSFQRMEEGVEKECPILVRLSLLGVQFWERLFLLVCQVLARQRRLRRLRRLSQTSF